MLQRGTLHLQYNKPGNLELCQGGGQVQVKNNFNVVGLSTMNGGAKLGNLSVGYDKGPFDIRLSLVSRSPYLDYLADEDSPAETQEDLNVDNIRYTDDHKQLDFNLKYDISDNLSIKFDINNIDDEPEYYYWGKPDRLSQYDVYGTTYSIGVRYKL